MLGALFDSSVWTGLLAAAVAALASILFLRTRDFFFDSLALAATETGLVLLAAGIVAGAIAGHAAGGFWWMWNPHLTAALVAVLLYAPYLMLRRAVEEPTRRAASAAVVSILALFDVPLIALTVNWWLAKRAATPPVGMDWTIAPIALLGSIAAWLRLRKEQDRRAQDAERRTAQEI
jgi:heme exporter protein C